MPDLTFTISAAVSGHGRDREGVISVDDQRVRYSVPASMGGKGVGASPETLLISAVAACYSLTLLYLLQKKRLPVSEVTVKTDGTVTGFPENDTYARITVNPVVHGGDPRQRAQYEDTAREACASCFIGQTVAHGGPAYQVGAVSLD